MDYGLTINVVKNVIQVVMDLSQNRLNPIVALG